jgi:hypothetical protein
MTLNEIATALEKLGADAAKLKPLFITVRRNRARACLIGLAESYRWWGRAFQTF